ncbi:MAG: hypothetical protein WCQ72_02175 [Eubacteriales bacterium]
MKLYKTALALCCCAAVIVTVSGGDSYGPALDTYALPSASNDTETDAVTDTAAPSAAGEQNDTYTQRPYLRDGQLKREAKPMRPWQMGDLSIEIYGADSQSSYYCVNFGGGNCRYFASGAPICLLMINGGFINCGGICINGSEAFAAASVLCSAVNAQFISSPSMFRISRGDTEVYYSFGSDVFNVRTGGHESVMAVGTAPYIDGGEIMLPLSKLMDLFGYKVSIERRSFGRAAVNTVIADNGGGAVISREKGLADVREQALEMYASVAGLLSESDFPEEALRRVTSDAGNLEIISGGESYGRYYIYNIAEFKYLNIYYDKYTGDIYSDGVYLMPFLAIREGVVDLTQIYWYDWDKLPDR